VPELHDLLVAAAPHDVAPPDLDAVRATVRQRRRRRRGGQVAGLAVIAGAAAIGLVSTVSDDDGRGRADGDVPVEIGDVTTTSIAAEPEVVGAGWRPLATSPLSARTDAAVVWTGEEVVVWGGTSPSGDPLPDGAAWDPDTDTWSTIPRSRSSLPDLAGQMRATWTGHEVVLVQQTERGVHLIARDLAAGRWVAEVEWHDVHLDDLDVAWTGSRVLIWGGSDPDGTAGFAFDPEVNRWDTLLVPAGTRTLAGGAWSGTELVTWMESDAGVELAAVDPATGAWRSVPTERDVPPGLATIVGNTLVVVDCESAGDGCTQYTVDLDTGAVGIQPSPLDSVTRLVAVRNDVLAVTGDSRLPLALARSGASGGWSPVEPPTAGWCCAEVVVAGDELVTFVASDDALAGARRTWPSASDVGGGSAEPSPATSVPDDWLVPFSDVAVRWVRPPGWSAAGVYPYLLADDAAEVITLATFELPAVDPLACRDVPTTALLALGEEDVLVSITERLEPAAPADDALSLIEYLPLVPQDDARTAACAPEGLPDDLRVARVERTIGTRAFDFYVVTRDASPERVQEILQITIGFEADAEPELDAAARMFRQDRDWMERYESVTGAPPDVRVQQLFVTIGASGTPDLATVEVWPDVAVADSWCWRAMGTASWCTADGVSAAVAIVPPLSDVVAVMGIVPEGTRAVEVTCDGAVVTADVYDTDGLPVAVFQAGCPADTRDVSAAVVG
jgi:hypothetical protein